MSFGLGGGAALDIEASASRQRREEQLSRPESRFAAEHTNTWLRKIWPFAAVLVMIIAVAVDEIIIALVAGTVLTAGAIAWGWARWSLERFEFSQSLSHTHAFVGETLELVLRFENRKLLPLPALRVRIWLSDLLEPVQRAFHQGRFDDG